MAQGISDKIKSLLNGAKTVMAVLLGVFLFGGFSQNPTIADEDEKLPVQVRHIYDPTLYDVESIEIFLSLSGGFRENYAETREIYFPEKIKSFFQNILPPKRNIPITFNKVSGFREVPDFCRTSWDWKDEVFTKPPLKGKGKLYLMIDFDGWQYDLYESDGVLVEVTPCLEGIGRVRLNFPENWDEIFPDAPIRYGDCTPPYIGWNKLDLNQKREDAFCKIKLDLFYIAWGLSQGRVGK